MLRCVRLAVGLGLIFFLIGSQARAQWGYGGWGWGGWGVGSSQSLALQGAGYYAMGAGVYNLDTAMARSINADTAMKWNDYVAQVTRESAMLHAARVNQEFLRDRSLYDAHQKRLRDNPGRVEIENGDALNVAVSDLSDPRLGSSALRAATAPVPASLIAEVPFENSSERVTIMLDQLRNALKWPEVFEEERFAPDKKRFDDVVGRARHEDAEGEISDRTIREAKDMVKDLQSKLAAQPLKDSDDQRQAARFISAFTALIGLLDKPDTRQALSELRKVKNTNIGNLLGFMHAYNLRFGPATTPKQRQAYAQLYETLDQTRDQILGEAKLESRTTAPSNPGHAIDFFQNFGQRGTRQPRTAPPPQPQTQPQ